MPRRPFPEMPVRPGGPGRPPQRRGPSKIAVMAAVAALVSGAWLMHLGTETHAPPAPSPSDGLLGVGHNGGDPGGAARGGPAPLPASLPQRVRIPAIRVDAPVMKLGVDDKKQIQVPPDGNANMAGWFEYGATPGAVGSAVLLGHVDTLKGPAVFYNLGSLHKGNTIQVTRADHRTAVFTIYGIEVYAKHDFPTDKVYDDTPTPELRVITCGGGFSKTTHSYLGNVVVYARLTATTLPNQPVPKTSHSGSASATAPAPSGSAGSHPTVSGKPTSPAATGGTAAPAAPPAATPAARPAASTAGTGTGTGGTAHPAGSSSGAAGEAHTTSATADAPTASSTAPAHPSAGASGTGR